VARLLLGKPIADAMAISIAERVSRLQRGGVAPTLAAISVRPSASSRVYVDRLRRVATRLGISVREEEAHEASSLHEAIARSNGDPSVHGILLLSPLPTEIDENGTIETIVPAKDVEGLHPYNAGRLARGDPTYVPPTAEAIMTLLGQSGVALDGALAVVVGRSPVIGQPCALLLIQENATVAVAHRGTRDLGALTRTADVLVVAVGHPGAVSGDMVRPGAVVADAGINVLPSGMVGDVDFEAASRVAEAITPVPGGVGALTTTLLLRNTVRAAEEQMRVPSAI
jgi:methylenetetrahydrofolate dehydrogenase (NADP+) / methenyltetrahydrofolate cyclohydrolase